MQNLQSRQTTCTPAAVQQARYVVVNMARVPLGGHKIQVVGTLGNPQKIESFMLTDGSMVEVMFYRTGEPGCPGMPTDDRFTPFVFQNAQLIGYGNDYYRAFILPSLKGLATPNAAPQHMQGYPQGQNGQNTPSPSAPTGAAVGYGEPLWQ